MVGRRAAGGRGRLEAGGQGLHFKPYRKIDYKFCIARDTHPRLHKTHKTLYGPSAGTARVDSEAKSQPSEEDRQFPLTWVRRRIGTRLE
jgi:hypothetical protein